MTFAKAYSGLDDAEILDLDRWIRRHTTERFGPVRAVEPLLVFELAFEGMQPRNATRAAWRCAFRGSPAGAATSRPPRPTALRVLWT